jgi:hypothetical protein
MPVTALDTSRTLPDARGYELQRLPAVSLARCLIPSISMGC